MADTFEIMGAFPTQRLDASQQIIEVIEATGVTKPHGVSFTIAVDKLPGWRERLLAIAAEEAAELEALFSA